ncbi:MAG: hypothetical protein GY804_02990 [Alphaproteobacteria bacterium]|nr:hypothetical protein [Alphaproteobacteria bacterium]
MTIEDFIGNLTAKFRSKEDRENQVFFTDLSSFVDAVRPETLQDIYNMITQDHTFQTIPRMGKFWKIAKREKFLLEKERKQEPYWNECKSCGAKYTKQGRGCPKCRCTVSIIKTGDLLPENIIDVQEDCFYCTIYPESVKKANERKLYFTGCTQFGIKQDAQCSACECKECCRQMMQYNADPKGTTDLYRTTELGQPWIYYVDPLNKTVEAMIADMTGRR